MHIPCKIDFTYMLISVCSEYIVLCRLLPMDQSWNSVLVTCQCLSCGSWDFLLLVLTSRNWNFYVLKTSHQKVSRWPVHHTGVSPRFNWKKRPTTLSPHGPSIEYPASFCNALVSSCPQLVKLSLVRLNLGNNKAEDIIQGMSVLEHLNSNHVCTIRCHAKLHVWRI